jgi:glycosyltransferase involved in cell wall biosynthesis
MRLILYTDSVDIGGAETSAAWLLSELAPAIAVTVAGIDRRVVEWIAMHRASATMLLLPGPRRRGDLGTLLAHVRALRRARPDMVQLNLITPWACRYAVLAALLLRHRHVIAVAHSPQRTSSRLYRFFMAAYLRRIAAVVSVGDRAAREIEQIVDLPAGSVRSIYNGVPEAPHHRAKRLAEGPVIGSLGRLDAHKGFDVLVRALPAIPDACILLVGDGAERDALLRLADEAGVRDRVTVTGWQEHPRDLLAAMDVYAAPSRLEGLPLGVCEAMLAELPVVATDVGSMSEAVVHGETGLLVAPDSPAELAEALRVVLADSALQKAFGERGRARALELFSMPAMVRAYESLYEEILG